MTGTPRFTASQLRDMRHNVASKPMHELRALWHASRVPELREMIREEMLLRGAPLSAVKPVTNPVVLAGRANLAAAMEAAKREGR